MHRAVLFASALLPADNRLVQAITVLGGLIRIAAGLAQILGKTLPAPWERS